MATPLLEDAAELLKDPDVPVTRVHWVNGAGEMSDGRGEEIGYVTDGAPRVARVLGRHATIREGWGV